MIIWGTTGLNSRIEAGTFHCPRCGSDKSYEIVKVNRWFTLYFIPLIPIGEAGRYLECKSCAGTFDEQVKHFDPIAHQAQFQAAFESAMLRALLLMAAADGVVDEQELERIADIMTRLSGRAFEVDEVEQIQQTLDQQTLDSVLQEIAATLNDNGKVLVLRGLLMIAAADGQIVDDEQTAIYRAGKILGFRKNDVKTVLASLES